jgi:hypothetical protein
MHIAHRLCQSSNTPLFRTSMITANTCDAFSISKHYLTD